jgi:hypothetical protein
MPLPSLAAFRFRCAAALLAACALTPAHAADDDESTAYGSVGLRYAIWGEAADNFKTENSTNKTAEFAWSLRKKAFFRARLEQADKRAAQAVDKVERYGFDAMFEAIAISTEFGRIGGVSTPSSELVYQDVGTYTGTYRQVGFFETGGFFRFGLLLVDMERPVLWRFAKGSCATVSGHCYFTDRDTRQQLYLAAVRYGTYWRGEPMAYDGWMPDLNVVFGLGLSRVLPSDRSLAGASAASGITLSNKKLTGMGGYVDGTFGMAYRVKGSWVTGEFAAGLYYRNQSSLLERGGSRGLEMWNAGHESDWGPYLRATLAF